MSNLPAGGNPGRLPAAKSNFSQTCSLLSQFLKEKGGALRDLNLAISSNSMETAGKQDGNHIALNKTVDLLTTIDKPDHTSIQQTTKAVDVESFHHSSPLDSLTGVEVPSNSKHESTKETKSAQMTIFYEGRVVVFDDFPADKARAVMLLASRASPHSPCGIFRSTGAETAAGNNVLNSVGIMAPEKGDPDHTSVPGSAQLPPKPQAKPSGSDLPIARRSSLHRFLDKRKDRAIARAPYQVQNPSPMSSKNGGESSSVDRAAAKTPYQVQNSSSFSENGNEPSSRDKGIERAMYQVQNPPSTSLKNSGGSSSSGEGHLRLKL